MVLATIKNEKYLREAYVWDQESLSGGISLDEAISRTATLYPIAYNSEVSQQTGIMGKGRGYQIEIGFESGSLTSYLDGGTRNVFYEIQERKLGVVESKSKVEFRGDGTKVVIERGFVGGPLKVEVYDDSTGNTAPAMMLIGTSREEKINRGGTWILAPNENVKIVVETNGKITEMQIYPIPMNEVENGN